ncbi:MAG: thioredoxin domain-containing protein [Anaerolineae bacterium]
MSTRTVSGAKAQSAQAPQRQQGLFIVIGIVVVAAIILVVAIVLSGGSSTQTIDFAALNPTRTSDGAFIIGDPDAPITLIEFADFGCPHCQEYLDTMHRFIQDYVVTGQARFEFRMFPTAGGQQTVFAGAIAECVDEAQPGAFWQMYDKLFGLAMAGRYFTDDGIRGVVQSLGLNYTDILSCSSSADQLTKDMAYGQSQSVSGTPAVMVRYGDGPAQWISVGGTTYDRGAVSFDVISAAVTQANS